MTIHGVGVDHQGRCIHWDSPLDVVANRFGCCGEYYACSLCHQQLAGHMALPWPVSRFDEPAVLCGVCRGTMRPGEYFACGDRCPSCGAPFNPGCRAHRAEYFETPDANG